MWGFIRRAVIGMRRGELDRLDAAAATKIGVNHVALDRSGPHDRHLDDEVVEATRTEPRQHVHLSAAFNLKDTNRIGPAEHVVNGLVLGGYGGKRTGQSIPAFHQLETFADAGEHAQAEDIHLEDAQCINVILVPFDDGSILHGSVADGHGFRQRPLGEYEAADMLG